MTDIFIEKFLIACAAIYGLWFLWRIAAHLEAIRDTLADRARNGEMFADRPTPSFRETNRL